jgi:tRNA G10  N-methylase Trm11
MKYFFILGNNPTLSIAEISAVFGLTKNATAVETHCNVSLPVGNVFILETAKPINAPELIKKLGGTIKIGEIADGTAVETNYASLPDEIKKIIETKIKNEPPTAKYNFGISNYTNKNINTKIIGMELKTWLKNQNISCRFVVSREKTLSSVVVEQNKLVKNGIEITILPTTFSPLPSADGRGVASRASRGEGGTAVVVGYTLAAQPFKELSFRDFGRPGRDDQSGMLPPKLAQIMINLAGLNARDVETHCNASLRGTVILDPFCGSGTILTEAMLMGYQNLIGSDISEKAIIDTKKNIDWVQKKFLKLPAAQQTPNIQLYNISSTKLSSKIKPNTIDAIITEPYLGPQRGKVDFQKTIHELENLYSEALKEFYKVLKPVGRVIMIWPVIYNKYFLNPKLNGFKVISAIPQELKNNPQIKLTNRNSIIYGREGQKVWREIVVLTKQ